MAQSIGTLGLQPQNMSNFTKAGNVTSGTPSLTATGTTTLGAPATSGQVSILAANGVSTSLGNVTTTASSTQIILGLDGNTPGSLVSGLVSDGSGRGTIAAAKAGPGTWVLTGANTYTGAADVNGGTLKLDFNGAGAPASNIIKSGNAVSLAGGSLWVQGKDGSASPQTFGAMTTAGSVAGSSIVLRAGSGGGSSTAVPITGLTANTGSTLNFDLGANTPFNNSGASANSFVNPGAFYGGNEFARYDGSKNVVAAAAN